MADDTPVFRHGKLRLYLLASLEDGPRSGYDVIRGLEERFDGLYSPSAGTVYPRLAKLEEEGLVTRHDEGRRSTYALTQAGRAELEARRDEIGDLQDSLDRSAERLATQMRDRIREGVEGLRQEFGAAASPGGARGPDWADLRRIAEQFAAPFTSDPARAWRDATDGPDAGGTGAADATDPEAPTDPSDPAERRGAAGRDTGTGWPADGASAHDPRAPHATGASDVSGTSASASGSEPASEGAGHDRPVPGFDPAAWFGTGSWFGGPPSREAIAEIREIVRDASARIQQVLERDRRTTGRG